MHITRLRLLGFKSFIESAELVIERGLTGVVGPNGCGKSNLLEGLRWVMGETSYKSMRASSMEDVIFSGTNTRPARNIAEVSITLDNRDRKAHPAFNDDDNLEITRRIERDSGSQYRINGKPVRARDVQLLFADASTGAHSPALVQQGRIGEIVSAKPTQRRFILEEAAGITGLHSRRHEAEIKLRGAENNLERLQDIIGQMESNLSALRRQERQVTRYREISRELERLTILQLYSDYLSYEDTTLKARETQKSALLVVGEKTKAEAQFRQAQIEAAAQLPKLRERGMVTAAVHQRLTIESEQLKREQQTRQLRKDELNNRRAQYDADLAREEKQAQDDQIRVEMFDKERQELHLISQDDEQARDQAATDVQNAHDTLSTAENELLTLNTVFAEQKALKNTLERERSEKQTALEARTQKIRNLEKEHARTEQQLLHIADFTELSRQIEHKVRQLAQLDEQLQSGEQKIEIARADENHSLRQQMEAQTRLQAIRAEINTLEKLLQSLTGDEDQPVLDQIEVTAGYETALGAALGDDLDASLNKDAELYWRAFDHSDKTPSQPPYPPLPVGTIPLGQLVTAPDALARRLNMTAIVERGEGDQQQTKLVPGQRLVSVEGDLWRWDGFVTHADAPTGAARRLVEKNRLEQLRGDLDSHQHSCDKADAACKQAQEKRAELEARHKEHKSQYMELRHTLDQQRTELALAERQASTHKAHLESLILTKTELIEQQTTDSKRLDQLMIELTQGNNLDEMLANVEQQTQAIGALRSSYLETKAHFDGQEQAERNRLSRIEDLKRELNRTQKHLTQGAGHIKTLHERRKKDELELTSLGDLPEQIEARREALNGELNKAQEQQCLASDQLQEVENALREIERSLQSAQSDASKAREERARCDARLEATANRLEEQEQLIFHDLECSAQDCLQKAGLTRNDELPERDMLKRQLNKATKDRERLGNVNLRADVEARELSSQIEEMSREHDDLIEAINALRTAISGLNKEGRRRLLTAFNEINGHFEALFTSLFGGGKARLELIESDDPLQAGLEIIASPPGKKPQVLTLLSGGEKALTALSLIFAVFLTNPAPICVLDEVDAPLDDANVERFCTLLDEMTKKTDTRFLVITHHPTTMSHMDRLFGVTMAEKGVSQMVSVDLSTAESYRETA